LPLLLVAASFTSHNNRESKHERLSPISSILVEGGSSQIHSPAKQLVFVLGDCCPSFRRKKKLGFQLIAD
ncbi:hypothetical protein LINPERPRIM_LOCUS4175, partial [Linum perenne]